VPTFVQRPGTPHRHPNHTDVERGKSRPSVVWLWCWCGVPGIRTNVGTCARHRRRLHASCLHCEVTHWTLSGARGFYHYTVTTHTHTHTHIHHTACSPDMTALLHTTLRSDGALAVINRAGFKVGGQLGSCPGASTTKGPPKKKQ